MLFCFFILIYVKFPIIKEKSILNQNVLIHNKTCIILIGKDLYFEPHSDLDTSKNLYTFLRQNFIKIT